MKELVVLRHVPNVHLGRIEDILNLAAVPFRYIDLAIDPKRPVNLDTASGLIVLGGPMSANDSVAYISRELYLIEEAIRRDVPVLGICLGAQLLAKAAGGVVRAMPRRELGWLPVYPAAAAADPLFGALPVGDKVFHWHGETFDLPAGAVHLASSADCPNQAFRLGHSTYGVQFHIEVTPAMISEWLLEDAGCGENREALEPIDPAENAAGAAEFCRHVVTGWLAGGAVLTHGGKIERQPIQPRRQP
jgi:GMP synthase-like glutamine amidotransferase